MPETKRFYYFTPTRYALEDIKEQRVKVAEMGKANDPYEMLPAMWNDPIERMALLGLQKYISGKYKIVCLSETYKDPSLWGHYADRCQGICLGFDIEVHKEERSRIITKMEYVRDRKDMSYFGISFVDGKPEIIGDKVATLMHYKSHHWEHEKEWRMWFTDDRLQLDPVTGLYFCRFEGLLELRKILVGFRCEEDNIKPRLERLITQYHDPKPEVFFTRLSSSTFEVEIDEERQK